MRAMNVMIDGDTAQVLMWRYTVACMAIYR